MATVCVQTEDFDVSAELAALRARNPKIGAVACFVGTVRDISTKARRSPRWSSSTIRA
ncbi:MAG: hypothetical protein GAK41_00504 [Burkholderia gladioli]|nr:MAG: hypothetical protein GAK41_00504 [Burkholderia gladioli]